MANLVYKGSRANLPAVRNADSFYMCEDTREIYFGNNLYTEAVRFYEGTTKPTNPAQGVLYISLASGDGDAYDGKTWHSVFAGSAGVDKKISDAIEALEVEDTAVDHQFVTAVAQEDGKVKVSRKALAADDIPAIPQSKVTGLEETLEDKVDIGESGDEASDDTIHGAKAYADEAVEAAKTELIGTGDGVTATTIKGVVTEAKSYVDGEIEELGIDGLKSRVSTIEETLTVGTFAAD